jgi:nitroreductase
MDNEAPAFVPGGDSRCLACGHCEALCPSNSIGVADPDLSDRTYPLHGANLAPWQLGEYLRNRRSIRSYRETAVDRAVLEELFDVVRYAPTARNSQTVRWLLIHDTVEVRRLTGIAVDWLRHLATSDSPENADYNFEGLVKAWESGNDPINRKAPHLIVAYGHKESEFTGNDAIIALSYLDAAAPAFGLGTCWAGFFQAAAANWEQLREALNLPDGHVPIYAMMIGYPAVQYQRIPKRNPLSLTWR